MSIQQVLAGQAYGEKAPKSICACGHSGDGAHSDHADTVACGHGPCKRCPPGKCAKFTWAAYTLPFQKVLAKVR